MKFYSKILFYLWRYFLRKKELFTKLIYFLFRESYSIIMNDVIIRECELNILKDKEENTWYITNLQITIPAFYTVSYQSSSIASRVSSSESKITIIS
jgi:hypothetical protein